jgi:hypothetical protein
MPYEIFVGTRIKKIVADLIDSLSILLTLYYKRQHLEEFLDTLNPRIVTATARHFSIILETKKRLRSPNTREEMETAVRDWHKSKNLEFALLYYYISYYFLYSCYYIFDTCFSVSLLFYCLCHEWLDLLVLRG